MLVHDQGISKATWTLKKVHQQLAINRCSHCQGRQTAKRYECNDPTHKTFFIQWMTMILRCQANRNRTSGTSCFYPDEKAMMC